MGRFLHHTNCPNCGSSDALAVYEAGDVYCFSCGFYKSSKVSPYVLIPREGQEDVIRLPADVTKDYNKDAVLWAQKYGITISDMLSCKNPIYYSPARNQLIFSWDDDEGKTIAWQARNLNKDTPKSKRYYTKGDVNNLLPIYYGKTSPNSMCVLVEDCLSAMKCSKIDLNGSGCDAMPLLGSGITNKKLSRLRHLYEALIVFLDPDMFHKAVDIVNRAKMLGFQARVIKADCDPKELTYHDLMEKLNDI